MNSQRAFAWRQKMPTEFMSIIEKAIDLKMYLLQELGPTSFVFKTEDGEKYKINIGSSISCSCSPGKKDHCIHTLYTCLKVFKREPTDPLMWQRAYIDSEISDLIQSRFSQRGSNNDKKSYLKRKSQPGTIKQDQESIKQKQRAIEEDETCPVCQEDMTEDQPITYCKQGCGHNYHIQCIKVWADHKQTIKEKITCPMCRQEWPARIVYELEKELEEYKSKTQTHLGHKCYGCKKKPIKGELYRCVFCENLEICQFCFNTFTHYEHDRFIMKESNESQWKPAPTREKLMSKIHKDTYNYIKNVPILPSINDTKYNSNYSQNLVQSDDNNINKFLIESFPYITKVYSQDTLAVCGLDFNRKCSLCQQNSDLNQLRRLQCGHLIDDNCLKKLIENNKYQCPKCLVYFLKGYQNLFVVKDKKILKQNSQQKIQDNEEEKINLRNLIAITNKTQKRSTSSQNSKQDFADQANYSKEQSFLIKKNKHKLIFKATDNKTKTAQRPPLPQKNLGFELIGLKLS